MPSDLHVVPADLRVRMGPDGLYLDLSGLGGTWVALTLADDPASARDAGLSLSLVGADGRPGAPLPEEDLGGAAFAWTSQADCVA